MIRYFCLLILLILVFGGCSGSDEPKEKFTAEDMGIVRLDNGQKVYYGMNRAEAEEVLGKGQEHARGVFDYDSGIAVFYRDDAVVAIRMEEESKGHYQTTRGAEIGMQIDEIKQRYGEQYEPSQSDDILDYFYDYKKGKFLEKNSPETEEEARNIFIFSSMFHDGYADTLLFMDSYYASSGK
ncbi:hypothetical protein AK95_10470 [Paenibacillus sp. LC231]|uniref:hypothetical protein n=1 Tax=Paenibacillus sp. LC231 TaxID=1120679 RepID=UPI0008DC7B13|nr:hypothetical protein [Paenibacillus sp. LC231]OIB04028.1 hypothetical protein AK95_10470 [Paenibacillus sp. LC231]